MLESKTIIYAGNLPENIRLSLAKLGFRLLATEACPYFEPATCYHPDLQFFLHPNGKLLAVDTAAAHVSEVFKNRLETAMFTPSQRAYENEAKLNIRCVGRFIFANRKLCFDISIPPFFEFIHVNQGYTACSSVFVSDNAVITDDASICSAARSVGLDVLQVSKGDVRLCGHDHGFIGGACGWAGDRLVFFGSLDSHRDSKAIRSFLEKYRVEFAELSSDPLTDYGGLVCV